MIEQLIENSLTVIRDALSRAKKPVVSWSAGKDSQVLLHLVRRVRTDIPILHIRDYPDDRKHVFADAEIARLGLNLVDLRPFARDIVARGDHVEILRVYLLGTRTPIYNPIGIEPDHVPGPDSYCAIEKLNEPAGGAALDTDCVFSGLRSGDSDQVQDKLTLASDSVESDGVLCVFPLRQWSEANIWEASDLLGIPQNKARYAGDMTQNNDYFPVCVECLKPTDQDEILCPKFGAPVPAYGKHLDLEARAAEWRNNFVNQAAQ